MINIHKVLDIKENMIFTKFPCQISIHKAEYKDFMVEYEDRYQIPGVIDVFFPELDDYCQIITPYNSIGLMKTASYTEDVGFINIHYTEGQKIVEQEYVNASINLPLLTKMIDGKLQYIKTPEPIINLLHSALPKSDLVHLELIISNVFRDNATGEPCRLTGDYSNSSQIGVTQLAGSDSWLSAIALQHIDRGINKALIAGKPAKMNPIEKVLNEEFEDL